ncbi:MAG: hypothetical protein MUE42_02410 [Opitutaceae bacterium]|nr:hypothetical protein [Opitutaceae bacterium]
MHATDSPSRRTTRRIASRRGSLLLTALLFSAIIAISLGSFLRLANQSTQLSYRTFYAGAAMNAAETGLEHAMWSINKRLGGNSTVWSDNGWNTLGTGAVRRTFTLPRLSGGATAQVKVYISSGNLVGTSPFVLSRSIITPRRGAPIERWVKISLSKRSRFSTGLVAKDLISFSGNNAMVDSYDSRLGAYTPSPSTTNRFARGSAGSASVQADTFNLGNADIWGFAVVGTSDTSGLNVGSQGTVGPFGTPQGTVVSDHVMTDFTANFEDVAQPAAYTGVGSYTIASISGATTLPRLTDLLPAADGKYYYNIGSISLGGNASNILTIANNVVIRMTGAGTNITIGGNASIRVNAPSGLIRPKVEIFTAGNVSIAGNGVANANKPADFMLWGTRPQSDATAQTISISGNGVLSSVVYAPNGAISLNGGGTNGNVFGSIIGKNISVVGGSAFHYDEALSALDSGEPLGMDSWKEYITYADRNANASYMNF